jgi:hypothetical protein
MSRVQLEQAHDLIIRKQYDDARAILSSLQDRSSTARRWLANLEHLQEQDDAQPPMTTTTEAPQPPTSASGEYHALSETFTHDSRPRWEYREIILRNWEQHLSNIDYALEQGQGEKITIEDAYVRLLNENGEQGWELISEERLPQQYIRLLMKRPVSA